MTSKILDLPESTKRVELESRYTVAKEKWELEIGNHLGSKVKDCIQKAPAVRIL